MAISSVNQGGEESLTTMELLQFFVFTKIFDIFEAYKL